MSSSTVTTFERMQISPAMKSTLKTYIIKQRQKKKEEEEQDEVLHRERKKREIKRQQDTATLEETNKQINQMENKLELLRKEKHDLFAQLKKVLHQEEEQRRRVHQMRIQQAREESEVLAKVGPLPANLIIPGASPPLSLINAEMPKQSVNILSSSSGPSIIPSVKRPRSPSPVYSTGQGTQPTSSGFLSPKHSTPPYQRSPYQQSANQVFAPRGVLPGSLEPSRFVHQMIPTLHQPLPAPFARMPIEFSARSPQYEPRPVAPQATHLPARIPQHIPQIPIVPQQKQMGSLTSGFPVNKPTTSGGITLPQSRLPYNPRNPTSHFPSHQQRM